MNPWIQLADLLGNLLLVAVWFVIIVIAAAIALALVVIIIAIVQAIVQAIRGRRPPVVEDRGVNVTPIRKDDTSA